MVTSREVLSTLFKIGRKLYESEDLDKADPKPAKTARDTKQGKPMKAFWESDKNAYEEKNQPFIDLFLKESGLGRIPDTTEKPTKESRYSFEQLSLVYLPEAVRNLNVKGVPEQPKVGTEATNSGRDAGVVAGIVVAVISGVIILAGLIAVVMYRHYVHRNVTSMNFDNPVYHKTTEDRFALEKNGYAPGSKLYPSTVGEEAQEPLTTPGTNEFV